MNNLLVLARDSETGASRVWNEGKIVDTVMALIEDKQADDQIVLGAVRVLDEVVKNGKRVSCISSFDSYEQLAICFNPTPKMFTYCQPVCSASVCDK